MPLDKSCMPPTLAEIVGFTGQGNGLSSKEVLYCDFIQRYRYWEATAERKQLCITALTDSSPVRNRLEEHFGQERWDAITSFRATANERPPEEFREVYELFVQAVRKHAENPAKYLYDSFVAAYAEILRQVTTHAETSCILNVHILPQLKSRDALDALEMKQLLEMVPEGERKKADFFFLWEMENNGVRKEQIQQYTQHLVRMDRFRWNLHREIEGLAAELGYNPAHVAIDITFFRYENVPERVWLWMPEKKVVVHGGILLASTIQFQGGLHLTDQTPEGEFTPPGEEAQAWELIAYETRRADAAKVLEAYLRDHDSIRGYYKSHLSEKTQDKDTAIFQAIQQENPDLPMTYGFSPSAVMHATITFPYRLAIDLTDLLVHDPDQAGQRISTLVSSLRERVPER